MGKFSDWLLSNTQSTDVKSSPMKAFITLFRLINQLNSYLFLHYGFKFYSTAGEILQNISEKMLNILWNYCKMSLCPRFTQLCCHISQRNSLRVKINNNKNKVQKKGKGKESFCKNPFFKKMYKEIKTYLIFFL